MMRGSACAQGVPCNCDIDPFAYGAVPEALRPNAKQKKDDAKPKASAAAAKSAPPVRAAAPPNKRTVSVDDLADAIEDTSHLSKAARAARSKKQRMHLPGWSDDEDDEDDRRAPTAAAAPARDDDHGSGAAAVTAEEKQRAMRVLKLLDGAEVRQRAAWML
jgi:hypothetical protein